jgi:predicted aspartyl protease
MATEPTMKNRRDDVGRFHVDVELTNNGDLALAAGGYLPQDRVRRTRISALVDTGATQLVLPPQAVSDLGLAATGQRVTVKFADGRREPREVVSNVYLEYRGRWGLFVAIVEPGRTDALLGAIVLEQLDLLADCTNQQLVPRDPNTIIAEIG